MQKNNYYGSFPRILLDTQLSINKDKQKHDEKQHLLDSDYQSGEVSVYVEERECPSSTNKNWDDPLVPKEPKHPTSNFDTMVHLLKGNIGTGILAMPDAFRNAGWLVGLIGILLMGFICTHCMHILVKVAAELGGKRKALGFSEVAEKAFQTGPKSLQKYSNFARITTDVFLCVTQIGFCCVYFVFVAVNLQEVVKHYFMDIDLFWYLVALLIPLIFLNWIKSLKHLTPSSLIASVLTSAGLIIIFWYMLQDLPPLSHIKSFSSWCQLPLFFGVAVYAFEGIGVVLPLENNMKNREAFRGWNGVLNTGMVITTCLYAAVGFFGYLKYGDRAVLGSVTLLLPANAFWAQMARVMVAVAIFLSYSLQFYVPFNIIWPVIKKKIDNNEENQNLAEYTTRTVLVFITFLMAVAIPNLGAVISLVGSFSSSGLALIFPPLIEILVFWPNKFGKYKWILWKDILICLFGFVGFFFGTYVSVLQVLKINVTCS